jgi:hypothetical protein
MGMGEGWGKGEEGACVLEQIWQFQQRCAWKIVGQFVSISPAIGYSTFYLHMKALTPAGDDKIGEGGFQSQGCHDPPYGH